MAVGGFILIIGLVLLIVGYTSGWSCQTEPCGSLTFVSGGMEYGLNLELFGAVISPTGAAILLYGLAAKERGS